MLVVNNNSFSTITTQSDNNEIMVKSYHFGVKRTNNNENKISICTLKMCNVLIITQKHSIAKIVSIK